MMSCEWRVSVYHFGDRCWDRIGKDVRTYRVASGEGTDVEEGERLLGLEELHRRDFSCERGLAAIGSILAHAYP